MRDNIMPSRHIHNARTRLKALRNNPRLHFIGPTPIATPWFNDLDTPRMQTSIHHNILQKTLENISSRKTARGRPKINGTEPALTVAKEGDEEAGSTTQGVRGPKLGKGYFFPVL